MLPAELNITQARRLLPSLIHDLELHPERVFRIRVRRRLVAEIKAPPAVAKRGLAAARLLELVPKGSRSRGASWGVSEDTDAHLYR